MALRKATFSPGPTHNGLSFSPRCSARKNTEFSLCPCELRSSGNSRVASSATSPTILLYRLSLGVSAETWARTSASPLSHASLRSRMVWATSKYTIANARPVPRANASVVQTEMRHAAVVRIILGSLQHVSDAPDRVNQRCAAKGVHFASQTIDMHIDDIGCRIDSHTPHVVQDHRSSHHTSRIAAKVFQERKLLRRQLEQVIAAPRFMPHQIQLQIRSFQPHRVIRCRR